MCKILAITNMSKVIITPKLIGVMRDELCIRDKDGFGYAVMSDAGDVGGERTTNVAKFQALGTSKTVTRTENLPFVKLTTRQFGHLDKALAKPKSLIAHGRMSTNTVSIENTHPFYNGDVALIHNGVVRDELDGVKSKLTTDCDSEILLRYWEKGGMEAIEDAVTGYYALAILDRVNGQLHIARDDRAPLYISWCTTIESYIIATTTDIINNLSKRMKWKIDAPQLVLDNRYVVFERNNIVLHRAIEPLELGYGYAADALSDKASIAFGHADDDAPSVRYSDLPDDDKIETKAVAKLVNNHLKKVG